MNITPRRSKMMKSVFDAITNFDCVTHQDIADVSGLSRAEIGVALSLIRNPAIAQQNGWTVPHVSRGRPRKGQASRFLVIGLSGQVLNPNDTKSIRDGTLSTVSQLHVMTRNQAHGMRVFAPMAPDIKMRRWAKATATILDGISAQAELEVQRIKTLNNNTP